MTFYCLLIRLAHFLHVPRASVSSSLFFYLSLSTDLHLHANSLSLVHTRAHSFFHSTIGSSCQLLLGFFSPSGSANSTWHSGTEELWACASPSTGGSRRWTGGGISKDCAFGEEQGTSCEFQDWAVLSTKLANFLNVLSIIIKTCKIWVFN